jgi:hypothetical protein
MTANEWLSTVGPFIVAPFVGGLLARLSHRQGRRHGFRMGFYGGFKAGYAMAAEETALIFTGRADEAKKTPEEVSARMSELLTEAEANFWGKPSAVSEEEGAGAAPGRPEPH